MRQQAGVMHLDGRPTRRETWKERIAQLTPYASDVCAEIVAPSILMAYRSEAVTSERFEDLQPVSNGPHFLTWDGRLDNREEIASRLSVREPESVSDAELVLGSYVAFGDDAFREIIGEFALALWSGREQCLKFARSACGARTLYYALTKNSLYWSSDFAFLVKLSRVDLSVNDDYAIDYLAWQPAAKHTPITKIQSVVPNRVVSFKNGTFTPATEIWDPTSLPGIDYKSDADYEEHFRAVLKQAVAVRLRAKGKVFAELSGGLDSSAIVLVADKLLRESGLPADNLQTVSCVYDKSTTCDEHRFIQLVEQQRGVRTNLVLEEDQGISTGLQDPLFRGVPTPLHCFPGRYPSIATIMRYKGARVLLTGLGGDHLFWSDSDARPIVADRLIAGDLLGAHRECSNWSRYTNSTYYGLFGQAISLTWGAYFPRTSSFKQPESLSWLHPKWNTSRNVLLSAFENYRSWRTSPGKRSQVFTIEHFFRLTGAGLFSEYRDLYVSHPYSHRPLVEFCLGTPISQFLRNGETRSLMRRSLRELLPHKVLRRRGKGMVDETIVRAVQREWSAIIPRLSEWEVCQRQYVDPVPLLSCLNKVRMGMVDLAGPLARLFSLERWLRSLSCSWA